MKPITPYSPDLGDRDPIAAMQETVPAIERLVSSWTPDQFERSYAPGKWSARQILLHLAQTEVALGTRARMALTIQNYTAQPFDQDAWMAREHDLAGPDAVAALTAISRMNVMLFAKLLDADRQIQLLHPEYGTLTVDWIIHQIAGHQIHHMKQLKEIKERA